MKRKKLFLILFLGILLVPLISLAGEYQTKDGQTVIYDGLVPCGKTQAGADESAAVEAPCQFCHVFVMLKGILDFVLKMVFVIGILMIVIAGSAFIYGTLISPGDPKVVGNAQKIMTSTIIGLVIIFGAWLFTNFFFRLIGVNTWTGLQGGWFTIQCDIELPPGAFAPPGGGNLNLAGGNGSVLTANMGENIDLGINFASEAPIINMHLSANFNNDSLELVDIIPNTTDSNFKTFLPIKDNGIFDKEKIIQRANQSGVIKNIGATSFDFNTGEFAEPQSTPIESLFTFVFKPKQQGTTEIILDSENSVFPVLDNEENVIDILGKQDSKIEIIINN